MRSVTRHIPVVLIVVAAVAVWLGLRTSPTEFTSERTFDDVLESGSLVVVEFYGNT